MYKDDKVKTLLKNISNLTFIVINVTVSLNLGWNIMG